jgi:flagellar biosynthetic protein FliR
MSIVSIATEEILILFLIICRITGIFFLVSPFSDTNVQPLFRMSFAFATAILMYPQMSGLIQPAILAVAGNGIGLLMLIVVELGLGLALGTIIKTLILSMQVAGLTIASQIGLSAAALMDPSQQNQNSILGIFLTLLTTLIILESGLHIRIIGGFIDSYNTIPVGGFFNRYDDFMSIFIKSIGQMWNSGLQISMPFILVNLLLLMGAGVLAKLMPQLQIFFVILPIQILIGIVVFIATLSGILFWFLEFFANELNLLF